MNPTDLIARWKNLPRDVRIGVILNVKARCADLLDEAKEGGRDEPKEMVEALMETAKMLHAISFHEDT